VAELAVKAPHLKARCLGTIAAVTLTEGSYGDDSAKDVKALFWEQGMLIRPLGPVVYFLPPYCVSLAELERAWDLLERAAG
jgi:adenosylmethionine-8-amino-7-oxononanoate aminotransferase